MIDALFTLLKRLAALTMLIILCDFLLPEGAMRRYARLAGGLMTTMMIASPLISLLGEVAR